MMSKMSYFVKLRFLKVRNYEKLSEIHEKNSFILFTSNFCILDFVVTFTDHCLTMLENSSRENVRQEADIMEESLNDEELAADAAITETFQKMVSRLSMKSFNLILEKLKRYAESHILEPAVAGSIFASMVKGAAAVQPDQTLDFFVPHLCSR